MTVSLHHNCPNDLNGRNSRRWPHTTVSHNYFPHNKPRRHIMGRDNCARLLFWPTLPVGLCTCGDSDNTEWCCGETKQRC